MAVSINGTQAINVTFDDFSSAIRYSNISLFTTPDPSDASTASQYAGWYENTYHATNAANASINFTFTGTDVYVYGALNGSINVDLGQIYGNYQASQQVNASKYLFAYHGLPNDTVHELSIRNTNAQLYLDRIVTTVNLAPANVSLVNTTIEDDNMTALTYTGEWGNNTNALFSGGTTHYTRGNGASVSTSFYGSAVYIWGDQNNDHGYFNVTLDGKTTTLRTPNGCGNVFGATCEKTLPALQYFAGYLGSGLHNLRITNYIVPPYNYSYFDLDRIVYTTPTAYLAPINFTNTSIPTNPNNQPAQPTPTSAAASFANVNPAAISILLLFLCCCTSSIF